MEINLFENIYLDVDNKDEEFSVIELREDLCYNPDPKIDEFIFKTQDYYLRDLPFGQKTFCLKMFSAQEFYEIVAYFTGIGYHHRLNREDLDMTGFGGRYKKEVWSLDKIREDTEKFKNCLWYAPWSGWLYLDIKVDYNKLDKFREDLKHIPGYKVLWLKEDREPKEPSLWVFK